MPGACGSFAFKSVLRVTGARCCPSTFKSAPRVDTFARLRAVAVSRQVTLPCFSTCHPCRVLHWCHLQVAHAGLSGQMSATLRGHDLPDMVVLTLKPHLCIWMVDATRAAQRRDVLAANITVTCAVRAARSATLPPGAQRADCPAAAVAFTICMPSPHLLFVCCALACRRV